MENKNEINQLLLGLGFNSEERQIFLALFQNGECTPLQLSRLTPLSRTQIYRLLENLCKRGIVLEIIESHTKKYYLSDAGQFERLLISKEDQLKNLKSLYSKLQTDLTFPQVNTQGDSKVIFYKGKTGIQQMLWNELKARGQIDVYSFKVLESVVGSTFSKNLYSEFTKKKIKIREVYSDSFLKSIKSEKFPFPYHLKKGVKTSVRSRYIKDSILDISVSMDIYNDTLSLYSWHDGDIFGIEIKNKKIVSMQKQIFDLVWSKGQERKNLEQEIKRIK